MQSIHKRPTEICTRGWDGELNRKRTPKDYDFLPAEPFGEAEAI